jgi:hypothetical protein
MLRIGDLWNDSRSTTVPQDIARIASTGPPASSAAIPMTKLMSYRDPPESFKGNWAAANANTAKPKALDQENREEVEMVIARIPLAPKQQAAT